MTHDNRSSSPEATEAASPAVGVTDESTAEIMDAFAALSCAMNREQEAEAITRVIAAVRADERQRSPAPALYEALKIAREALKANEEISGTWELYQHSPEMKAINAALHHAEGHRP